MSLEEELAPATDLLKEFGFEEVAAGLDKLKHLPQLVVVDMRVLEPAGIQLLMRDLTTGEEEWVLAVPMETFEVETVDQVSTDGDDCRLDWDTYQSAIRSRNRPRSPKA